MSRNKLIKGFSKTPTSSIYTALWEIGYRRSWMKGIKLLTMSEAHVAGPAVTVEFLPYRFKVKDLSETAPFKAAETVKPGDIVVYAGGGVEAGLIGDCVVLGYKVKGVVAVVVDGGVRDVPQIRKMGFPVFGRQATPSHLGEYLNPGRLNAPINCAGVQVKPGDIVVGDGDGVVVVPIEVAEEVLERAVKHELMDEESRKRILAGWPLGKAYPPKEEWIKGGEGE